MSEAPVPDAQPEGSRQTRNILLGVSISVVLLTFGLVLIAVALANNAQTAALSVQVIRDLLIIVMALELIVIGAAITVLLIQIARFINLLNNEVRPLVTSTSDTLNTVRGTAVFLSKNLTEPVIAASSALRGIAKAASDVETIRKFAGMAAEAVATASPTGGRTSPASAADGESAEQPKSTKKDKPNNKSSQQDLPKETINKGENDDGRE